MTKVLQGPHGAAAGLFHDGLLDLEALLTALLGLGGHRIRLDELHWLALPGGYLHQLWLQANLNIIKNLCVSGIFKKLQKHQSLTNL